MTILRVVGSLVAVGAVLIGGAMIAVHSMTRDRDTEDTSPPEASRDPERETRVSTSSMLPSIDGRVEREYLGRTVPSIGTYNPNGYKGFWAIHENTAGGVVVYVSEGLTIADPNRRQRMICVMCLLPTTDEPAGCANSRPFEDTRNECGVGGGLYMVKVRPRDQLLWGEVMQANDIVIDGDEVFR
jgi:hypothetical protein